jgi:hypothetical protein
MPDISFLIPSRLIGWYDIVKDFQSLAVGVIGFGSIFVKDIGLLEPQQVALVIRAYGANRHLDMTLSRRARQTNFVAGFHAIGQENMDLAKLSLARARTEVQRAICALEERSA